MSYGSLNELPDFKCVCVYIDPNLAKIIFFYLSEISEIVKYPVISRIPYINHKKHGIESIYYSRNVILSRNFYINNRKNGLWIYYNENGELSTERFYIDGKLIDEK
jgi:hypothetical protein